VLKLIVRCCEGVYKVQLWLVKENGGQEYVGEFMADEVKPTGHVVDGSQYVEIIGTRLFGLWPHDIVWVEVPSGS